MYTTRHSHSPVSGEGTEMLVKSNFKLSRFGWSHDFYHDVFHNDTPNTTSHSAMIHLNNPAVVSRICMEATQFLEDDKISFCDGKILSETG